MVERQHSTRPWWSLCQWERNSDVFPGGGYNSEWRRIDGARAPFSGPFGEKLNPESTMEEMDAKYPLDMPQPQCGQVWTFAQFPDPESRRPGRVVHQAMIVGISPSAAISAEGAMRVIFGDGHSRHGVYDGSEINNREFLYGHTAVSGFLEELMSGPGAPWRASTFLPRERPVPKMPEPTPKMNQEDVRTLTEILFGTKG